MLLKFVLYLFLFSNKSYEWLPGIWFISTLQNSRYTARLIMTIFVFLFFFSFWIEQIVMFLISVIIALIYGLINTESSAKWASVRCIDPNIQEMMILIDATEVKITRYNWRPPSAYALHCCINLVRPYKTKLGFLAYICISCTSHTLYSSFQTYPWYHSI